MAPVRAAAPVRTAPQARTRASGAVRIRDAERRDIAPLVRLMTASPLLREYAVTASRARAALAEALDTGDVLLVAADRDRVVGLAWLIPTRALDRTAYLRLLLVAEAEQSRGLGADLLARAERRARSARARHLALLVTASNRGARRFYRREGYRYVATLRGFVRRHIDEALYVRDLPRATTRASSARGSGRSRPR